MKLRFVVFKGLSKLSRVIRFFTRSCYSHVAILLEDGSLIEAWNHSMWIRVWWDYSTFEAHTHMTPYEVWELEVPPGCAKYCSDSYYGLATTTAPYDWRGVLGFVLCPVKEKSSGWFCSEGAWKSIAEWYGIGSYAPPYRVSPDVFVALISAMGARKVREEVVIRS